MRIFISDRPWLREPYYSEAPTVCSTVLLIGSFLAMVVLAALL